MIALEALKEVQSQLSLCRGAIELAGYHEDCQAWHEVNSSIESLGKAIQIIEEDVAIMNEEVERALASVASKFSAAP